MLSGVNVIVALPDTQVFFDRLLVPNTKGANLREAVSDIARTAIPIELDTLTWDYYPLHSLVGDEGEQTQVLFVGALTKTIAQYVDAFQLAGVKINVLDVESSAIGRALLIAKKGEKAAHTAVIDIGSCTSTIALFDNEQRLQISASKPIAGDVLTATLASALSKTNEEVEELKRKTGFISEDDVYKKTIEQAFLPIINTAKEAITFYEHETKQTIKNVLLVGGSALLPGIVEHVANGLKKPVILGDPMQQLIKSSSFEKGVSPIFTPQLLVLHFLMLKVPREMLSIYYHRRKQPEA